MVRRLLEKGAQHVFAYRRRFSSSSGACSSTRVMSFGDGSQGALGLPSLGVGGDAYEPTPIPGLPSDVSSISAGHYHSLAVTAQGHVWAWGRNDEAQLGRGLFSPRYLWNEPKRIEGLDEVKVRATFASGVVSTAIGEDGSLWVWGKSKRGQLGLGKGITEALVPSKVEALVGEEIIKVSLGWGHTLAHTKDGNIYGWGYCEDGRLGRIEEASQLTPPVVTEGGSSQEVAEKLVLDKIQKEDEMQIMWEPCLVHELGSLEVSDVACGLDHSLVLCSNGTLLSSGSNTYGQLGRKREEVGMLLPVDVKIRPLSIAAGLGHSLAVCGIGEASTGTGTGTGTGILSWGWNCNSQLGRTGSYHIPGMVEGMEGEEALSVSGGRVHSISLTSKGEVWVWGCGKNGRLGLGSSADEVEPTLLECLQDFEALQAVSGFDHNLVLIADR